MSKKIPTVAIVGRTNVGKSSLFNALAGKRVSIVEDSPGVTRDRHSVLVKRFSAPFTLIDTGGVAGEQELSLEDSVRAQTNIAIEESDLVLAMFDGLHGVHPQDSEVVRILRECRKPILWVVNKCESPSTRLAAAEFYTLGIEEPLCVSAAHGEGIDQLAEEICKRIAGKQSGAPLKEPGDAIRIAVVGRPNVGKSSIVNRILGEERVISSPVAGTTRDSVDIRLVRDGQDFVIVDTAGLRKKSRIEALTVERFSALRALRALARSDVAVLVLDATAGVPSDQDIRLATLVHERGRGLIIVVNKWDAVAKDHRTSHGFEEIMRNAFRFAPYAPVLFVSALTGQRCPFILRKANQIYKGARERIKTATLNRILSRAFVRRRPPVYRGDPIKLYFATQTDIAPPTFVLFVNHPRKIPDAYLRYVKGVLREEFPFEGTDIRFILRKRTEKEQERRQSGSVAESEPEIAELEE